MHIVLQWKLCYNSIDMGSFPLFREVVDPSMKIREKIVQFTIFFIGIMMMSFGIVLTIQVDLGVSPWDVLHIGLYQQFGLSIGTWNIIVGIIILGTSAIILKSWPKPGAYFNLLFVGVFVDLFLLLPIEPIYFWSKLLLLLVGIIIMAIGMGIYISAQFGTGPRDSLMMALHLKKGWKVPNVRLIMEVSVLMIGSLLGGPVHIGTIIISLTIGHVSGAAITYFYKVTNKIMDIVKVAKIVNNEIVSGKEVQK